MGVTGFENLTEEELKRKLDRAKEVIYNIEREQRHRKEAIENEKHKDIIGKIFYNKEAKCVVKISKVSDVNYYGRAIEYFDSCGLTILQDSYTRAFTIHNDGKYCMGKQFLDENWKNITEEEANDIIEKWKKDCIRFNL